MFRKRRVATPGFGHTPWNPIHGDHAQLRQDGTAPFCAMMQIAAEDTYDDYVICRGFDTRILRFIDYAEGDASKPGISVAKPFGKRTPGTYQLAEIYPAFLPTQGNSGYADFRQVVYTPPSPVDVVWRVGQNPGVVSGGLTGGQPESLADDITILHDHNGKVINWLLIDSNGGGDDHYLFTMLENMGVTDGEATIRTMDDLELVDASADVKNTLGDFSHLVTTDRGICVKVDGVYYAVHPEAPGEGETIAHVFTLTSGLSNAIGATGTASVLISGEEGVAVSDTITVYNTGNKLGFAGAVGIAIKIGAEYWVVELDQLPIRMEVVLEDDTHYFSPAGTYQGKTDDKLTSPEVSISAIVSTTPYPFAFIPTPVPEITNPYNLIGLVGDKGIVTYNADEGEFQLVEILPRLKLRVRFKLTADMPSANIDSTTDYIPLESRQFTSGEMPHLPSPPTDAIYDPMQLVVNGKEDDEGIIEYSYKDTTWQVSSFRRRDRELPYCKTWHTEFLHLQNIEVEVGQVLQIEDQIGTLGEAGDPGDPHLHYAVKIDGISIDFNDIHFYPITGTRALGTSPPTPPTPPSAIEWARQHIPIKPVSGAGFFETLGSLAHDGNDYWARDISEASYPTQSHSPVVNFAQAEVTTVEAVDAATGRVLLRHECHAIPVGAKIFFEIDSAEVAGSSSPYNGKTVMTVTVICEP